MLPKIMVFFFVSYQGKIEGLCKIYLILIYFYKGIEKLWKYYGTKHFIINIQTVVSQFSV